MQALSLRRPPKVQRDMDLLREILMTIENDPNMDGRSDFAFSRPAEMDITGRSDEEFVYHLRMLVRAGLIDGHAEMVPVVVRSLTWEGHEFIDNIRNDNVWTNTKKRVGDLFNSLSLSVVVAVAEAEAKKLIGLK